MLEKIKSSISFLKSKTIINPEIGIILGTGLGGLVNEIDIKTEIKYEDIPHFPVSSVKGHSGKLLFGYFEGKQVVAMQGRFHFYEGWNMEMLGFPIRVLKALGINLLILSNASGGINPDFEIGDVMIINDHINLLGTNPLIGKNYDELGPRFVDMLNAYDKELINRAIKLSWTHDISCKQGVYACVSGPCFETPAEYKYLQTIGADAVGMSTVPEVIVARHMGLKCFAVSVISDLGVPGKIEEISHDIVLKAAEKAEGKMTRLLKLMLTK